MKVAAKGGHGLTLSGDAENPPGPALGDPALAKGLDKVVSRGPFQPQWFSDSVIHLDLH